MIDVVVFGAAGRMGATVCRAVAEADDMELVAAVDPAAAGRRLGEVTAEAGSAVLGRPAHLQVAGTASELSPERLDVAIDFTSAVAAHANLLWCASQQVHAVSGTTGLSAKQLAELERAFERGANCLVAPNFSIGAVLMMRCAELCSAYFEAAEVIELHHDKKKDAPSGTSLETLRRMAEARGEERAFGPDRTETTRLEHVRGGLGPGGVRLHSVRLPGLVAHQEVIFGSPGETLTLRHDSTDRLSFMPGVLAAARKVAELPGLTVGLEPVLGL